MRIKAVRVVPACKDHQRTFLTDSPFEAGAPVPKEGRSSQPFFPIGRAVPLEDVLPQPVARVMLSESSAQNGAGLTRAKRAHN